MSQFERVHAGSLDTPSGNLAFVRESENYLLDAILITAVSSPLASVEVWVDRRSDCCSIVAVV